MTKKILVLAFCFFALIISAQKPVPVKPRILISTDIGGTDPDDNQSMTHLLMYGERFEIEGLISSPSYGNGTKQEILRMIGLYEKDLPKLQRYHNNFPSPEYLRSITKQGQQGNAPFIGYTKPTEGSEWIIRCAKKESSQPLWILCWGGLEDLAQALHDAPEIQKNIRVYWIGGPNKKWSANSYAYIVANFPELWFIEVNSSYYGLFSNNKVADSVISSNYYDKYIKSGSHLGKDFKNYYNGEIKMGDTPSVLYMMDGDPDDPYRESWGGSFEKLKYSPRIIYKRTTTTKDSVAFCSIIEFRIKGPKINIASDSICFWMEVPYGKSIQKWPGYYLGRGIYSIRYIPKKAETLSYKFTSEIPELNDKKGHIVIYNHWPGKKNKKDYKPGNNWYSDKSSTEFYFGDLQGGNTVYKWKNEILSDWAKRWNWLNNE